MKKLKVFFIICAAVFVAGLGMSIAGAAAGGVDGFEAVAEDHDWVSAGPGAMATVSVDDLDFDSIESTGVTDVVIAGEDYYDEIVSDYKLETVLDPQPGTAIAVFGSNIEAPDMAMEGKTLVINGGQGEEFEGINLDFSSENAYPTVIVFCPDKELEKISISSAFSDVELKDIAFKEAEIGLNYGDVEGKHIKSQGIKIESDSGDVELSGELQGETEVTTGAGDIEIETADALKAYAMDIETSVGDIKIGDKEKGVSYKQDGGKHSLVLRADTGDIEVSRID